MHRVRRLYEQFAPSHYQISLDPDKDQMTFAGSVRIDGRKCGRPSQRLTLHAKDLKIDTVKLLKHERDGWREVKVARVVIHKSFDELRLHSDALLYPGEYRVKVNFSGKITRPMNGLYPCYYKKEGPEEIILATQFESHHAREVFPCIDEPEAKAVFVLKLVSPKDEVVLSNTDPASQSPLKAGRVQTVFAPTPKMSTYLLAFIIGKIDCLSQTTAGGVTVRGYAKPSSAKHMAFALDTAVKTLEFFNDYFGIDYPLPKCDLVALPDFAAGAMENWGLITFREQAVIVDPDNTSLVMKQYVASVIAHELTHQWFGNLVTMRWWNDLWLNESFATLMSYVAVDALFPEWQMWVQFMVEEQAAALRLDALESTHPINVTIRHPDEIRTIFDNISYEKGASVLLMLMRFLGENDFRKGLKRYLKRHAYASTESTDLWHAWQETAGEPIGELMQAWTTLPGFPLVTAALKNDQVELSQQRFYINPRAKVKPTTWTLPLFSSPELNKPILNLSAQSLRLARSNQPLILNHDRSGFARVIYDRRHTQVLAELVVRGQLTPLDRLGLIDDSFEAAKAGLQSTTVALDLLKAYAAEDNVVVWDIIAANLGNLRTVMDDDQLRDDSNAVIRNLVAKQYRRLGWIPKASETHFDQLLRPVILGLACASEDPDAIKSAKRLFGEKDKQPLHPDIRGVVFTTVARSGGKSEFDELVRLHNASTSSEERLALTAAVTNFKQPELIEQAIMMVRGDTVRLQDVTYWISDSFANRYAKALTWQWLKLNWDWLKEQMGNDLGFYMMPRLAARVFSDLNFIPEFENFFRGNQDGSLERPLQQAVETITWQGLWKQRDQKELNAYFAAAAKAS